MRRIYKSPRIVSCHSVYHDDNDDDLNVPGWCPAIQYIMMITIMTSMSQDSVLSFSIS